MGSDFFMAGMFCIRLTKRMPDKFKGNAKNVHGQWTTDDSKTMDDTLLLYNCSC